MSRLSALLFKLLWKDNIPVYYAVEHATSCFGAGLACDNQWCEHARTSCYQSKALFVIPVFQQLYLLQQSVDTVQNVLIICMVNTHISHIWEHHPPSPPEALFDQIFMCRSTRNYWKTNFFAFSFFFLSLKEMCELMSLLVVNVKQLKRFGRGRGRQRSEVKKRRQRLSEFFQMWG